MVLEQQKSTHLIEEGADKEKENHPPMQYVEYKERQVPTNCIFYDYYPDDWDHPEKGGTIVYFLTSRDNEPTHDIIDYHAKKNGLISQDLEIGGGGVLNYHKLTWLRDSTDFKGIPDNILNEFRAWLEANVKPQFADLVAVGK